MNLRSDSFVPYQHIPVRFALGKHDPESRFAFSENVNPHLAWSGAPDGTQSFAVICVDEDVPSVGDDVNQVGHSVDVWLPRAPFFHWVLANLPAGVHEIEEGAHSSGVTQGGKSQSTTSLQGGVSGINDYTNWFAGDATMGGDWFGYDGPAPPWNDERIHGYRFQVFALDVATLDLPERFDGATLRQAMQGHVLASAELVGLYAINPDASGLDR